MGKLFGLLYELHKTTSNPAESRVGSTTTLRKLRPTLKSQVFEVGKILLDLGETRVDRIHFITPEIFRGDTQIFLTFDQHTKLLCRNGAHMRHFLNDHDKQTPIP